MSKTQNITISNEMSKIFICNTTSESSEEKKCSNDATSSSSITILTPDLQIQINNSSNKFKEKTTDTIDVKKHSFDLDEEVFLEGSDGRFYLGTVINSKADEYLIKFDDNTEKWSSHCKLKKLTASPTKNGVIDSLCVICKISNDYDVVEVCDKCSRGYHRQCIKQHNTNASPRWNCSRCSYDVISISDSEDLESISAVSGADETTTKTKLSYDLNSLKWDAAHRTNKESTYCYCGLTGVWKEKMFQCCRCRQWFHENCVKIWNGNLLLNGDTFFLFCCAICNEGTEFIRRIHMNMRDIIHLVLYELTVTKNQRFHSISRDVVPFLIQNWDKLILPEEFQKFKTSRDSLEKKVLQVVKAKSEDLFKCVVGAKKKGNLYGLRKKAPPAYAHLQKIRIPQSGPFTDDVIKKLKLKVVEPRVGKDLKEEPKESKDVISIKRQLDFEISDSDETSRSALDLIIPRPENFRGSNNPFHINYRSDVKLMKNIDMNVFRRSSGNGGSKFPEVRIVRTIKRRLSAKDILLGPNQEVKRRKITKRRKSSDVEVISEIIQPIHMPLPTYIPRGNSTANLRPKNEFIKPQASSANAIKMDSVINSPKKNINLYFGAKNRVENGEKFTIMAKRITFDGKEQYLVEWDNDDKNSSAATSTVNLPPNES